MKMSYVKIIALIAKNPKTLFWSLLGILGMTVIGCGRYWYNKKQETKSDLIKAIEEGRLLHATSVLIQSVIL